MNFRNYLPSKGKRYALAVPLLALIAFIGVTMTLESCKETPSNNIPVSTPCATFSPVELSDSGVPNFNFPEDSFALKRWAADTSKYDSMYAHAWGIWEGLTNNSGECFDGQELLVFETWLTPADIIANTVTDSLLNGSKRAPRPLAKLNQLHHGAAGKSTAGEETVLGFVKYNPAAATHIEQNNLLNAAHLQSLLDAGDKQIPLFPTNAISLKPVFQAISQAELVDGKYYQLDAWHGLPETMGPYPSTAWGTCVWVDVTNSTSGGGTGSGPCSSGRTDANTFNVSDFIAFKLTAAEAAALTAQSSSSRSPKTYAAGDYSILLAMHITSREFSDWTWQSTYWDPSPSNPQAPSSMAILAQKPANLNGAAAHYAITVAYSMVYPPVPVSPTELGTPVYAFNPYLEAGFGPSDLPFSAPWTSNGVTYNNQFGVQTNCMSCHAGATFQMGNLYTADQFVDLDGPQYNGMIKTDFLWSIGQNAQ